MLGGRRVPWGLKTVCDGGGPCVLPLCSSEELGPKVRLAWKGARASMGVQRATEPWDGLRIPGWSRKARSQSSPRGWVRGACQWSQPGGDQIWPSWLLAPTWAFSLPSDLSLVCPRLQRGWRLRVGCLSPSARRGLEEKGDSGEWGIGSLQWDPGAESRAFHASASCVNLDYLQHSLSSK